jgi:hypothetical protein
MIADIHAMKYNKAGNCLLAVHSEIFIPCSSTQLLAGKIRIAFLELFQQFPEYLIIDYSIPE